MAHKHSVYDTDTHFLIDPITREIKNENLLKVRIMQGDHNSERYSFELPRYIEGHDMSTCGTIKIHYININNTTKESVKDIYLVDDMEISEDTEHVVFTWLLKDTATRHVGGLNFRISFYCMTDEVIDYRWNTAIYSSISVGEGIDNTEAIATEYSDILEAWKSELSEEIANMGGGTYSSIEPMEDDIPKVFFDEAIPQTKTETVTKFRYISKTQDISGYAEFKAQGNSSMSYPKKNMTVKMYEDEACETKLKVDFKGWGKQSKHVYKANWIDLTHARNIVSARLWAEIVKSRSNYAELPVLLRTSPNQGAVDGFPVKVYSQGIYQGRYTLNIPKDKWTTNMDDDLETHCILCGENYVSGCFRAIANINGSDWTDEIHDTVPTSIKTRWNEVITFVMNSTDEEFKTNLSNYFDVESLIDYYIFGIVSCGLDAFGKNQLFFTYDGIKWIASMYDMDATWGLWWNGSSFVDYDYARNEFQDFKDGEGNLLYIKLENNFINEIKERASELLNDVLSIPNIINEFERFTDISSLDLVKEDYASTTASGSFTGIPQTSKNNIQQIRDYVVNRYSYCMEYFESLIEPILCTGITLNKSTLEITDTTPVTLVATIEPSDTTETVVWESDDTNVATVSNGVVTPIAKGTCTITATCGSVSATCTVIVDIEEIVTYTITRNLVGCTSSSEITSINEGTSHTETISVNNGYMMEGATTSITMGDDDISSLFVDGVLNISSVTGDIVINIECAIDPNATLYPFENGTKTLSNGTVIEVTDGNHLHIEYIGGSGNINTNVGFILDEDDVMTNIAVDSSKQIFNLQEGDIVRTVTKFGESHTATSKHSFFLYTSSKTTINLINDTTTEVDNTMTMTENAVVRTVGYYMGGSGSDCVVDIEVEIYVNNVRYV